MIIIFFNFLSLLTHTLKLPAAILSPTPYVPAAHTGAFVGYPKPRVGMQTRSLPRAMITLLSSKLPAGRYSAEEGREGQFSSCICYYRRTHGLPCSHEILKILLQSKQLRFSTPINIHWHTLSIPRLQPNLGISSRLKLALTEL